MHYLAFFFTGVCLCNAIPHLACGLQGLPFPTPFAKPRGIGDSSPMTNTLWGLANLAVGVLLLLSFPFDSNLDTHLSITLLGALVIGMHLSRHFQQVRDKREAKKNQEKEDETPGV